ncbi:hypothetical protein PpBr36_02817 [Pyricularia pennisetigena]|uniref:hypothetical protein n=1 Tax=Pyricularia pennisetigena TaxID=1578925 RepID=UPI001153EFB0|nr:hypothetical protein PpBr36_02817 [Pyricularia pennisetigena]TLS30968.1 hypothetical protein PpBr36_02817 [Pyricularia pennisetigena]
MHSTTHKAILIIALQAVVLLLVGNCLLGQSAHKWLDAPRQTPNCNHQPARFFRLGKEEKRKLLWVTAPQYANPMSGCAGIGAAKAFYCWLYDARQ